jgi:hypothetical protein
LKRSILCSLVLSQWLMGIFCPVSAVQRMMVGQQWAATSGHVAAFGV